MSSSNSNRQCAKDQPWSYSILQTSKDCIVSKDSANDGAASIRSLQAPPGFTLPFSPQVTNSAFNEAPRRASPHETSGATTPVSRTATNTSSSHREGSQRRFVETPQIVVTDESAPETNAKLNYYEREPHDSFGDNFQFRNIQDEGYPRASVGSPESLFSQPQQYADSQHDGHHGYASPEEIEYQPRFNTPHISPQFYHHLRFSEAKFAQNDNWNTQFVVFPADAHEIPEVNHLNQHVPNVDASESQYRRSQHFDSQPQNVETPRNVALQQLQQRFGDKQHPGHQQQRFGNLRNTGHQLFDNTQRSGTQQQRFGTSRDGGLQRLASPNDSIQQQRFGTPQNMDYQQLLGGIPHGHPKNRNEAAASILSPFLVSPAKFHEGFQNGGQFTHQARTQENTVAQLQHQAVSDQPNTPYDSVSDATTPTLLRPQLHNLNSAKSSHNLLLARELSPSSFDKVAFQGFDPNPTSSEVSSSPLSQIGSDTIPTQSQSSDKNEAQLRCKGCMECILNPGFTLWPCDCGLCTRCCGRSFAASTLLPNAKLRCCKCSERVNHVYDTEPSLRAARSREEFGPDAAQIQTASHIMQPPQFLGLDSAQAPVTNHLVQPSESLNFPNVQEERPQSSRFSTITPITTFEQAWKHMPLCELGKALVGGPYGRGMGGSGGVFGIVKIENIPYNLTENMLFEYTGRSAGLAPEELGGGVHIIMDRTTGKTMDCFLEFISVAAAQRFITRRNISSKRNIIGGRHVTMEIVNMAALMKLLFPKAKGVDWQLEGGVLLKEPTKDQNIKFEIISREELVMIVGHARTPHRSPFSRKCLQRPYESLLSIVSKFPWYAADLYTIRQRDRIYAAVFEVTEILKRHIMKDTDRQNLGPPLMRRIQQITVNCRGFTDFQKHNILKISDLPEFCAYSPGPRWEKPFLLGGPFQGLGSRDSLDVQTCELFMPVMMGMHSKLEAKDNVSKFTSVGVPQVLLNGSKLLAQGRQDPVPATETTLMLEDIHPDTTVWDASQMEVTLLYNFLKGVLPSENTKKK